MPKLSILPQEDAVERRLVPVMDNPVPTTRQLAIPSPPLAQMIAEARRRLPPAPEPRRGQSDTGADSQDNPIFRFD